MNEILSAIPGWVPRFLLAVLALATIFALRRALARLLIQPVQQFAQRRNVQFAGTVLESLSLPTRIVVLSLGLLVAVNILQPDSDIFQLMINLTRSLIIIAMMIATYRMVDVFALSSKHFFAITGLHVEERLIPLIRTAMKIVVITLALIIIMQQWGVDVSGLVASLGIIGLAFSLAAQDTVSNLFGFSTIVGDRPFVIGEYIKTPDVEGIVEQVGIRSTRVRQPDRALVTVPNSILASAAVQRFTRRRISFILGVTYSTTADQMETLLKQLRAMLEARQHVLPASVAVYFTDFGDSSLNITIFCDLTVKDWRAYMAEREEVNLAVMRIVADLGLSVAFPSRSVYVESMPPAPESQDQ